MLNNDLHDIKMCKTLTEISLEKSEFGKNQVKSVVS